MILAVSYDPANESCEMILIFIHSSPGLYLTAHFYASDDAHEWLHAYLTTHAIDRRLHTGGVGLIPTLLEGIFPIGHTPPREVTATTRRAMIIRSYSDVWSPVDAEEVDISQAGVRLTYSPIFGET